MTNLVYHSSIYRGYLQQHNIRKDLEVKFLNDIIMNCNPSDLFINSTWGEVDDKLIKFLNKKPKRVVVYSGMDWENTICRKTFHRYIKSNSKNIINIGNSDGLGYFSFWLFFIEKYFLSYSLEELEFSNPEYLYMCLNRKRHSHRVQIVKRLKEELLLEHGIVSLGGDSDMRLSTDVEARVNTERSDYNPSDIPNDILSIGHLNNWNKYLINVVTETTVHTNTFISEKTWKPIIGLRPFMIVGDRKIYSYLKEYGIDTFDDIFGTGYQDPIVEKRIEWVIDNLKKYSKTNLVEMYKQLYPRLVRNKLQLQEIFKINNSRYQGVINILRDE